MNSLSATLQWVGFSWQPELRRIRDRSDGSLVGLQFICLGLSLQFLRWNFKISNWQAGSHVAQNYFVYLQ